MKKEMKQYNKLVHRVSNGTCENKTRRKDRRESVIWIGSCNKQ